MENNQFDSVVMLTWSDWATELRSNRYHYATRFAKQVPVIFVQPDRKTSGYRFEKTEIPQLTILHVSREYNAAQSASLNAALVEAGCMQPIFWVYNGYFDKFLQTRYSLLNVYHGTEDYLASDSHLKIIAPRLLHSFNAVLQSCQVLVAVSDGVADSFARHSAFRGNTIVSTNGCDFKFYQPASVDALIQARQPNVIFYQGNIFDKLDYDLLLALTQRLSDWQFVFCGRVVFNEKPWKKLLKQPNVTYLGILTPEQIREQCYRATVGIIPFAENEWLIERSFPLKAFEYLACGLPVVSVPIKALLPYGDVIDLVSGVDAFEEALRRSPNQSAIEIERRLSAASSQDYDLKFERVLQSMQKVIEQGQKTPISGSRSMGIFYQPTSAEPFPGEAVLKSFKTYSQHAIYFIPVIDLNDCSASLRNLDAVVLVCSGDNKRWLDPLSHFAKGLQAFGGYKILLALEKMDEDVIELACRRLGIHQALLPLASSRQEAGVTPIEPVTSDALLLKAVATVDEVLFAGWCLPQQKTPVSVMVGSRLADGPSLAINPNRLLLEPSDQIYQLDELNAQRIEWACSIQELWRALMKAYQRRLIAGLKKGFQIMPERVKTSIRRLVPMRLLQQFRAFM